MDSIHQYLTEIARHPLLTPAEEIQYSRQIQRMLDLQAEDIDPSDYTREQKMIIRRGQRAKERMITRNLRLVVTIAKKYTRRCSSLEMLDLVQFGNIGLDRATELFDPSRGYKFSTYAYWWIRQSISRGLQDCDRMIRLPIHRQEKIVKLRTFMTRHQQTTGREPTLAECAAELEIESDDVMLSLVMARDVTSLDNHASNDIQKDRLIDLIPDEKTLYEDDDLTFERDMLADALNSLGEEDRYLVCSYNGLPGYKKASLSALGNEVGISREGIRQRIQRSMMRINRHIRQQCQNEGRRLATNAGTSN